MSVMQSVDTVSNVKSKGMKSLVRRAAALVTALGIALTASVWTAPVTAEAASNEWTVYEYLTDVLGFNTAAACGIMANINCESHFNPGAGSSGGGGAYGLCQWMGGRKSGLKSWCRKNGFSSNSIEGQLSYAYYELSTHYPSVLYTLTNVEESADGAYNAGYAWCCYYEKPANTAGTSAYRGSLASGTYWPTYSIYVIDQWLDYADGRHYIRSGEFLTGLNEVDGERYFFDENGVMQTGFQKSDGKKYYFDENGVMVTGWLDLKGDKYYFAPNGIMKTGDFEADGQKFTTDKDGRVTGIGAITEVTDVTTEFAEKSVKAEEAPVLDSDGGLETSVDVH